MVLKSNGVTSKLKNIEPKIAQLKGVLDIIELHNIIV